MVDQALGRVLRGEERRSRYEPQRREPWRPAPNGPEPRRPEPSGPEPWRSHLTAVCPHLKYPSQVNPLGLRSLGRAIHGHGSSTDDPGPEGTRPARVPPDLSRARPARPYSA